MMSVVANVGPDFRYLHSCDLEFQVQASQLQTHHPFSQFCPTYNDFMYNTLPVNQRIAADF